MMAKVTVQMTDEMNEILREVARRRGVPKTAALRRAVALLKYLDEASERGEEVVLRNPETHAERQIVFESNA
jgi:predicted transcriptional regulator